MKITAYLLTIILMGAMASCSSKTTTSSSVHSLATPGRTRWSAAETSQWYEKQPWLVGSNFLPSSAINQLEMWQAESFDVATIDRELGWGEDLGMNTMRVFLHDLLYKQDAKGFLNRIDRFLKIAHKHKIRPLFVLFDSCWDPFPQLGKQRAPLPFTHNSGWVQNPGALSLQDSMDYPRLETYVKAVVGKFANDDRILGWDVWNEPDNTNGNDYHRREPINKIALVYPLLKDAFGWCRSVNPSQPLTSGVWKDDWSSDDKLGKMEKLQLEESDIISFHNYSSASDFDKRINWLQRYERPIICTEYMARPEKSTFQEILPVAKKYKVGAMNWGFVSGKSQTIYPWDSWTKKYSSEPPLWFHDIFRPSGAAYKIEETEFIKMITKGSK